MINLKNLIDFLPFEYKDQDTYKVNGKGILERFLEICGEHFEDYITKDIENILDIIDIDKTPDMYLNFLWQFLGEMPFAYGNTIDAQKWSEYFNGFYSDSKLQELSKLWIIPKEGPFTLTSTQVRNILKYSVSLFKIRGTSEFFEIMMRLYGLTCTVTDPAKADSYDGWVKSNPRFDQYYQYDDKYTYDNTFDCSQCIPVTFRLTGHGYTSNSESFKRFREAVESFFKRFIPYHVSFIIQYGFTINDGYTIKAELVNPEQPNLITSEVYEVPVRVTVTADWINADLRYQISSDGVNWGYTKHASGSVFYIPRAGTYYFRSVGDNSKVTQITVNQESYNRVYSITCEPISEKITPSKLKVSTVVRANVSYKGTVKICNVRLSGTDQVKGSGSTWEFTEPGTYIFEIVEFPVKQTSFVVTREEITYKVRCTPSEFRVGDKQSIRDAVTTLTIESNYPESFTGDLYCRLIGDTKLFKNGDKFTASSYGTYKFKCTLDKRETDEGVGIFEVTSGKTAIYRISINPPTSTLFNGSAKTTVNIQRISGNGDDYRVRVVETGETFNAASGYVYTTNRAGTYTFQSVAYPTAKTAWVVNNSPTVYQNKLKIVPSDATDSKWKEPNWSLPEDQIDDTYAIYQLLDEASACKFHLEEMKNGVNVSGTATCDETGETYNLESEIILTKAGTYTFTADDGSSLRCQVILKDYPTVIEISCTPEYAELKGTVKQVSTLIKCTSNKPDFDSRVREVGKVNTYDAGGAGYEFITATAGEYIFESVADTSKRTKFTVVDADLLSVSPQVLEWEHDDLSEKTFTITTYSNQSWQIVEQ